MSEPILEIQNISKNYGKLKALNNLSFSVNKGDIYGILGPNGSGKTTILSIISDILKANSGNFIWHLNSLNYRKNIGTLIETPNFYHYLTVEQNLKIVVAIKEVHISEITKVLKLVKLDNRKNSLFRDLSLGLKQRLALASALVGNPTVIVLDEPTNGLDPEGIAEFREIIIEQAKLGKTIIIASHVLDEIEKVCTNVAILKKGTLIKTGKVNELLSTKEKVIISSTNIENTFNFLVQSGITEYIKIINSDIELILQNDFDTEKLNEYLFKNNIILSKLDIIKTSLESQFLEIIK